MRKFYDRFLSVRQLSVPVIAAINGPAVGAGLCLALACDLRIAAKDAKLGVTFVGLGLHPVKLFFLLLALFCLSLKSLSIIHCMTIYLLCNLFGKHE